jgi:hypothetical protein
MTLTATKTTHRHRPLWVTTMTWLLGVLGIGAVGGGWVMIFGIGGESMLPDAYLDSLPLVHSWVLPGLVLMIGFGFGSLLTGYGVHFRPTWRWVRPVEHLSSHHWSWLATILLGAGQMVWIGIEVVSIPFSFLMPTFGLVGLALFVLPLTRQVSDYLRIT